MQKKQAFIAAGIVLVVLAGLLVVFWNSITQSAILGEEGYVPYDSLLSSGSFDKSKWSYVMPDGGCVPTGQNVSCYPTPYASCVSAPLSPGSCVSGTAPSKRVCWTPYQGISASNGNLLFTPIAGAIGNKVPVVRTNNLRLANFKMEFSVSTSRAGSGSHGGTSLYTNKGLIASYAEAWGNDYQGWTPLAIELVWDDFALGHYQVKSNGVVVQEGNIPEGGELYFYTMPDNAYTSNCYDDTTATAILNNPRMKQLFSCDEGNGEYLASMTFKGFTTINLGNLQGFKRFCVAHPSIYLKGGVSANSVQLLYQLAGGQTVTVQDGDIRKVFYIADGRAIGATQACESGAFNVNTKLCDSLTGIVDICPVQSVKVNGSCVTFVENTFDINMSEEKVVGSDTIWWNAYTQHAGLTSGETILLSNEPAEYDCQSSDGHNTYDSIQYPRPSASCWTLLQNGEPTGTTYEDSFFSDTLSYQGRISYYDDDAGVYHNGDYKFPRDWNYRHVTVVKPLFSFTKVATDSGVTSGDTASMTFTIKNSYPQSLAARVAITYSPEAVTDVSTFSRDVTLPAGESQFTFSPPTGYIGNTSYEAVVILKTNIGNVVASGVYGGHYEVKQRVVNNEVVKVIEGAERIVYVDVPVLTPPLENQQDLTPYYVAGGLTVLAVIGAVIYIRQRKPKRRGRR